MSNKNKAKKRRKDYERKRNIERNRRTYYEEHQVPTYRTVPGKLGVNEDGEAVVEETGQKTIRIKRKVTPGAI